jgi:diguanylate cyclase (GGDEF)-like protein
MADRPTNELPGPGSALTAEAELRPLHGLRPPRLLIVDDDELIRLVACESLGHAGFEVAEAEDGARGIEAFDRLQPDLVLLDVQMPDLDGFHVCDAIRRHPSGRHVPVLIMTGLDDVESIERAYQVGATDFVSKPLNWVILVHRVRYMLRANQDFLLVRSQEARLDEAQQLARLGSWEIDLTSGSLTGSKTFRSMLALSGEHTHLDASSILDRIHLADRDLLDKLLTEAVAQQKGFTVEHRIVNPDSSERIVHTQARMKLGANGNAKMLEGFTQDITERRHSEEHIRFLAFRDSLTGLANREAFTHRLQIAIHRARRTKGILAVLYLDLDHFKRINDTLGHPAGDVLLESVADRLVECVRHSDFIARSTDTESPMMVSRLGGDEFTALLEDLSDPQDAARVARRVNESLERPIVVEGREIFITGSIGIAIWPNDGEDGDRLMRSADSAMYHAKEHGRANFQFYREALNQGALERLELETRLRRAVREGRVLAYYQPKFEIATGRITGCEALARWDDEGRGFVSPSEFIPVAESTGLICELGESVLRQACAQVREWQQCGHPDLTLNANLSPRQLKDEAVVEKIARVLHETRLHPMSLELEITESALIHNEQRASAVLDRLRKSGVRISLDDFGTGYSSLSYLKRFRVHSLKIDRSFVQGIGHESDDEAIISAILSIARNMNLRVVAEGIETEQQLAFLKRRACDEGQGYLLSQPLSADAFAAFLNDLRARSARG